VASGELEALKIAVSSLGAELIDHQALSLDEIFLAQVGTQGKPQETAP
jgi:hypothetical protein